MKNKIVSRAAGASDLPAVAEIADRAFSVYLPPMDRKPFPMLENYNGRLARNQLSVVKTDGRVVA